MAFDAGLPKTRQAEMAEESAALIRKGWTQYRLATNKRNFPVSLESKEAVNFCALGALSRIALSRDDGRMAQTIANKFADIVGMSMSGFNDNFAKSAEDVAKVFDRIANDQ